MRVGFFAVTGNYTVRPTASHDVPPRSAWTACRALVSAHVSSPLVCAGFLTPKREQLKTAGSQLLDSYPKNARFETAMLSYCQNGTQFPCRVWRLHQRLAPRSLVLRSFLGRATVARPPQRVCQDACRKGTGSLFATTRGSRGGDRGGCFRQVLESALRARGTQELRAGHRLERVLPPPPPPLFFFPEPCRPLGRKTTSRRSVTARGRTFDDAGRLEEPAAQPHNSPAPPPTTTRNVWTMLLRVSERL